MGTDFHSDQVQKMQRGSSTDVRPDVAPHLQISPEFITADLFADG
jgi:hypothetical protein